MGDPGSLGEPMDCRIGLRPRSRRNGVNTEVSWSAGSHGHQAYSRGCVKIYHLTHSNYYWLHRRKGACKEGEKLVDRRLMQGSTV